MTIAAYLIIGVVVHTIVTIESWIRNGWKYFKTYYNPGWVFFTDMIAATLLWPYVVLCYALGAVFTVLRLLKTES